MVNLEKYVLGRELLPFTSSDGAVIGIGLTRENVESLGQRELYRYWGGRPNTWLGSTPGLNVASEKMDPVMIL